MFQHVLLQVLLPRSLKATRLAAKALVPCVNAHVLLQVGGGLSLVVVTELAGKALPAVPTAFVNPHHLFTLELECAHLQSTGWYHYNAGHVNHAMMSKSCSISDFICSF